MTNMASLRNEVFAALLKLIVKNSQTCHAGAYQINWVFVTWFSAGVGYEPYAIFRDLQLVANLVSDISHGVTIDVSISTHLPLANLTSIFVRTPDDGSASEVSNITQLVFTPKQDSLKERAWTHPVQIQSKVGFQHYPTSTHIEPRWLEGKSLSQNGYGRYGLPTSEDHHWTRNLTPDPMLGVPKRPDSPFWAN